MKVLYYDCFAGISGDMNLGALLDLGVDQKYLLKELGKLSPGLTKSKFIRINAAELAVRNLMFLLRLRKKHHHITLGRNAPIAILSK